MSGWGPSGRHGDVPASCFISAALGVAHSETPEPNEGHIRTSGLREKNGFPSDQTGRVSLEIGRAKDNPSLRSLVSCSACYRPSSGRPAATRSASSRSFCFASGFTQQLASLWSDYTINLRFGKRYGIQNTMSTHTHPHSVNYSHLPGTLHLQNLFLMVVRRIRSQEAAFGDDAIFHSADSREEVEPGKVDGCQQISQPEISVLDLQKRELI
ncbi:unnamed protein product [Leuciscus chuanchicus]